MAIEVPEQPVRERAYALWEARGRSEGNASDDWFAAELEVKAEIDAVSTQLEPLAATAAEVLRDLTEEAEEADEAEGIAVVARALSPFRPDAARDG